MLINANNFVKYMPFDRSAINPILDASRNGAMALGILGMDDYEDAEEDVQEQRIMKSGKTTKRSVSETKKKFVASQQDWTCKDCGNKLNAWFEVDHKIRLEYGGSNHIDNLVALCRDCHGEKTAIENL